jgi:hypothetical protein
MLNPEKFTGYAGASAHHVWQAIYEENCFGLSEAAMDASKAGSSKPSDMVSALSGAGAGGIGFSKLSEGWGTEMIKGNGRDQDGLETCEEKRVYYRVISGDATCGDPQGCELTSRSTRINLHPHLPRLPRPDYRRMGAKSSVLHHPPGFSPGAPFQRLL